MQMIRRAGLLLLPVLLLPRFFSLILAQGFDCEEELFSRKDKSTRLFGYVNALGEYRIPPIFLKAKPFVGKTAIVQQGKSFGLINCEGILVVPAEYEEIASFFYGKGWVKKNGLFGLISDQGRMLIQPVYEDVKEMNTWSGSVTWVKKAGQWGLLNRETGRQILAPRYDDVSVISDSAAIARSGGLQDLVYTGDGRVIIQGMRMVKKLSQGLFLYESPSRLYGVFNNQAFICIHPEFESIRLNQNYIQTRKGGKSGLRSLRGSLVLEEKFDSISPLTGGFVALQWADSAQIRNPAGKWNLPPARYQRISILNSGFALVQQEGKTGFWAPDKKKWIRVPDNIRAEASKSGDWLRISRPGKGFLFCEAKDVSCPAFEWDSLNLNDPIHAIRASVSGRQYLISALRPAPDKSYEAIIPLGNGFFSCRDAGKFALVKAPDEIILPAEFSSIVRKTTNSGLVFLAKRESSELLFSEKGKQLYLGNFNELLPASGKLQVVSLDGKWGIAKADGSWLVENRFDSVRVLFRMADECRFPMAFYRKGKATLIDESGKEISDAANCIWFEAGEGRLFKKERGRFTLFDSRAKQLGDAEAEDVQPFAEGMAAVKSGGVWGFINGAGRMQIPSKFQEVLPFQGGIAYAKENGLWGVLNKNGAWLLKPSGIAVLKDGEGKRRLVLP